MRNYSSSKLNRMIREGAFALASVGLMTSCGKLPDYQVGSVENAFVATGGLNPDIDILFVIDNSGSMSGNQTVVFNSINSFLSNFMTKNLNFHIGVVGSDQRCNPAVHSPMPNNTDCTNMWRASGAGGYSYYPHVESNNMALYNDRYGSFLTKDPTASFVTWQTPNAATVLGNNVRVGIRGDGGEMPLLSAVTALSASHLVGGGGWNSGFSRNGSFLAVILITDEDEAIAATLQPKIYTGTGSTAGIDARVDSLISAVVGLNHNNLKNFSLSVIARPPSSGTCAGGGDKAFGMERLVSRVNTLYPAPVGQNPVAAFADICNDFSAALVNIGTTIIEANARYPLGQPPANPDEIVVSVNGSVVSRGTSNGWEYYYNDTDGHYIQFFGTAIPAIGDQISVAFTPGAPI